MKDGGAEIRVLRQQVNHDGENWRGKMVEHARNIAEMQPDLVGYVMIGLFSDGSYSIASRLDNSASPIPLALLPAYAADVIRRDLIFDNDVRRIIDEDYVRT